MTTAGIVLLILGIVILIVLATGIRVVRLNL